VDVGTRPKALGSKINGNDYIRTNGYGTWGILRIWSSDIYHMGDITIVNMEYYNINIATKINNFFKRVKSHYYNTLAILHKSKDRELNALIIGQIIVLSVLGLIILGIKIF